ncbi:hypothetical protein ACSX1A_07545 [Pontibacter sp. MBLB2868]|uniref:hypothetical protein n=1 Tax=Pontibacter sp. MBLB2868 TaxID=3451555 RepID=UPI003F7552F8
MAGVLFSVYIFNSLLLGFGEGIPVNLIIVFLACLQWIIGPVLSYYTGINHPFYGMNVPEEVYFSYTFPGVILFHFGLLLPLTGVKSIPKIVVSEISDSVDSKLKSAYYLIGIGFFSGLITSFAPPFLFFFLYLLSQLKFVGCFYLYLSERKDNRVLYLVFATLILQALSAAMFHDLVLWVMFFLFIYCIKNKVTLTRKLTTVAIGLLFLIVLQSVKYQYRSIAWTNPSLGSYEKTLLFSGMMADRILNPADIFDAKANELAITRLNQGWIIAKVMQYVPFFKPHAEGVTISGAFNAALLPRFIAESKATAGGRVMMERFTGIVLQDGTSMNISLIGEGYGNYGRDGGILFMFLIGIVYSLILRQLFIKSQENPTLIFWIPFLFLQVVKAETDLTTTLNYLVKASITMFIVFFAFRKILKIEL